MLRWQSQTRAQEECTSCPHGAQIELKYAFRACAADAACDGAYPNLRERFAALVTQLNASPLVLVDGTALLG